MNQIEAHVENVESGPTGSSASWADAARQLSGLFERVAAMPSPPSGSAAWRQVVLGEAVRLGIEPVAASRLAEAVAAICASVAPAELPTPNDLPSTLARGALRIDHVAIAVKDLESAIGEMRARYGFEVTERREIRSETSGMVSATLRCGGVTFVLCQGTGAASNVSRYIEAFGQGVQHLAIEVLDERAVVDDLRRRGTDLLTDVIAGPGLLQAFTRRSAQTGMQLEFVSRTESQGFDDQSVMELYSAMDREDVF